MKKILLILTLMCMIIFPVFSQTGSLTTNEYFYLPEYGSYGTTEYDEYNAYMEIADNQIEANKTAAGDENICDVSGAMWTDNTETFITITYQDADNTVDAIVPVKDEDNMASDSATHLATQQSIKAYADSVAGSLTEEEVEDFVGGMLGGTETNITVDYQDATNDIDFVVTLRTQEEIDDWVNALIKDADSVHTRITITYDDTDNAFDFVVDNDLHNYSWTNVVDADITNTLTASNLVAGSSVVADSEVDDDITIDLATLATTITVTDNESTAENNPICFIAGADPDGGSLGIETDGDLHYNPSTGTLTTTIVVGEVRLVTSDADPDTTGEIKHDSTATGFTGGVLRWYDNDSSRMIVDLETDATDDDYVVAYDADADRFYMKVDSTGAGGSAIVFDIGDDGGNDSTDVNEIATSGDTNSIFTEPTADKILITLSNNWPGADLATLATTLTITDNESTAENNAILFTSGGDLDGGNLGIESDGTCYYTPSTGKITTTGFVGALTGNADTVTGFTPASGSLTLAGADALTITTTAASGITLPTSGTLYGTLADSITSANLISSISDETGTGVSVFGTSPTFTTQITTPKVTSAGALAINSASNDDITIQPNGTGDTIIYAPADVVTTSSANNTLTIAEAGTVLVSNTHTEILPTASGHTGLRYHFIKTDADYDLITLDGDGAETFNYENSTSAPVATYTRLNTYCAEVTIISDGTNWQVINEAVGQSPDAWGYLTNQQTNFVSGSYTKILLDAELYDIGSNFDTTNNKYVAPVAGMYLVSASAGWADSIVTDKRYVMTVYNNGANIRLTNSHSAVASQWLTSHFVFTVKLAVNDYLELYVKSEAGVDTVDVDGGSSVTFLNVKLLAKD